MDLNLAPGVYLPVYQSLEVALLQALEHASLVLPTSSDNEGEFYAMAMAHVLPAAAVPNEAIIVIPLTPPEDGQALDFTYLAASKSMFVQVHEKPQARMTYGHCLAYSTGVTDRPVVIEGTLKFPTTVNFIVAKPRLVDAIRAAVGPVVDIHEEAEAAKRQCVRPLVLVGEQAEGAGEKLKGTSFYLVDLEGVKHPTRTKTDIPQREKDLNFIFRAMDVLKWDYSISMDCVIQPEQYRSMLCEQGDTQTDDRHEAFMSCGLISRVQKLQMFSSKEKIKLLMIGSVLLEGGGEPTITLEDFVTGEKVSSKAAVCSSNNTGLIAAVKNFQTVMQIIFSDAFETCLEAFIDNLEGVYRPMELVAADFLRYSIESTLRRFFRVVRSVKTSDSQESLGSPEKCATFLTVSFDKLSSDLSNHQSMARQEASFRLKVARRNDIASAKKSEICRSEKLSVKFGESIVEDKKIANQRTCSGFFGSQLGAVRKDGRPYACNFGKDCAFSHVSVAGKSKTRLRDIVSTMTPGVRTDLTKAIEDKK